MIVPTLGRRLEFLRLCLTSIAEQHVRDLDVVLVAPAGPEIETVATEYGARLVPDPRRGGLSGALNAGLAAARPSTEYVAWLGDDDLLAPGSLPAAVAALERRPDSPMVFGWCDYIDAQGNVIFRSRAGRVASLILRWGPNLIPQPGSLMRLQDVLAAGGLDESVRLAMDLDLFLRLRQRGPFVALPQTLASFRWHDDSATVLGENLSMEESDQLRMKYMSPAGALVYRALRWPGRLALWLAKRRVDHNAARQAGKTLEGLSS